MLAAYPLAYLPLATIEDEAPGLAFALATEDSRSDAVYLIEIAAYQPGVITGNGIMPMATFAMAALPDGDEAQSGVIALRFSDRGWMALPEDATAPNTRFPGRASDPLTVDRVLPLDPTADRRVAINTGSITFLNGDRALDSVVDNLEVDGRAVTVKFGRRSDSYADFGTVFSGVGVNWVPDSTTVNLNVRDASYSLDTSMLRVFGGTGGLDGDEALAGQVRNQAWGTLFNISPQLLNAANVVYGWHDGSSFSCDAARDKGKALTIDGDDPDYATLLAASIAGGHARTCLALSLIRCGSTPDGQLTLDVRGDVTGGVHNNIASAVIYCILTTRAFMSATLIESSTFSRLASLVPGVVGIYFSAQLNYSDAVSEIVGGIGGHWGGNRRGKVFVGRIAIPEIPSFTFDTRSIVGDVQGDQLPDPVMPCIWRSTTGFRKNWTVQTAGDLVDDLSAAEQDLYGREFTSTVPNADTSRLVRNITAQEIVMQSIFVNEEDAEALDAYEMALYAPGRKLLDIPLKTVIHRVELNDCETIVYPRYRLDNGRKVTVIGISETCKDRAGTMTVYG